MKFYQIKRRLDIAIQILRVRDSYLLKNDVSERAITHKLAEHLQYVIGNSLDVDCEYNKNIDDSEVFSKKIYVLESEIKEMYSNRNRDHSSVNIQGESYFELSVFPDIIVHKRGKKQNNILAIEVKKSTSRIDRNYDYEKLKCYTESASEVNNLGYKYGAFVRFNTGSPNYEAPEVVWFKDGKLFK
ncbi:hypothetical protein [Clostridium sp. HBUAS56017]|uniref:hypothetical protein n=1 Tax=Clostridium sp. HBUAS56017 TaxID=2571128 RepID=UPI001178A768|nr:hypothetical protein [Clostridium sp. HBUAS56017]